MYENYNLWRLDLKSGWADGSWSTTWSLCYLSYNDFYNHTSRTDLSSVGRAEDCNWSNKWSGLLFQIRQVRFCCLLIFFFIFPRYDDLLLGQLLMLYIVFIYSWDMCNHIRNWCFFQLRLYLYMIGFLHPIYRNRHKLSKLSEEL